MDVRVAMCIKYPTAVISREIQQNNASSLSFYISVYIYVHIYIHIYGIVI